MSNRGLIDKSISELSRRALTNLSALSEEDSHKIEGRSDQVLVYNYSNEIQRLDIWIGEHGVSDGRLDSKLREASQLRNGILELLTALSGR